MKRFKKFIGLACVVGLIGLVCSAAEGAETTLRFAGVLQVGHHATRGMELFAKLIGEKTGGKIEVQVYPAATLFSDKDMMQAVPSGALDIGVVTTSMWTGLVPSLMFLEFPLYFKDRYHMWRAVDGEAGEILKKDFEAVGVKLLYWMDGGKVEYATKNPLRTMDDFKGQRLRVAGEVPSMSLKAFGAAPAFLGGGEVYMALQRGTVDGGTSVVPSLWQRKYYEVTKYMTDFNIYTFAVYGVLMNLRKWNALPLETQKVFLDCAKEAQEWGRKECEKMDNEFFEKLKTKLQVHTWSNVEKERLKKASDLALSPLVSRVGEKGKRMTDLVEKVR